MNLNWPPNKAWTSSDVREGFRHFVAFNYGGSGNNRWVTLVSVLDGRARMRVLWTEMTDAEKWTSGWVQLSREEANPCKETIDSIQKIKEKEKEIEPDCCLHPSNDSGLCITSLRSKPRPWFFEEKKNRN